MFKSIKEKVKDTLGLSVPPPPWKKPMENSAISQNLVSYLHLEDLKNCRVVSNEWETIFTAIIAKKPLCFIVTNDMEMRKLYKHNKIIARKIWLQNLNLSGCFQNGLLKLKKSNITELEITGGSLDLIPLMRIVLSMEKLEVLKISCTEDEQLYFDGKFIESEQFKDDKFLPERFLPRDIKNAKQHRLKKVTHNSPLLGDIILLLKLLSLKCDHLEEFELEFGGSKYSRKDHIVLRTLYTSLMNLLVKNDGSIKKLKVGASRSIGIPARSERVIFKGFLKAITDSFLKDEYKGEPSLKELCLNFPGANFEKSSVYNTFVRFLNKLTNLEKLSFGPVKMKLDLIHKIVNMVPANVNCNFPRVYAFQNSSKSMADYGTSTSTVSMALKFKKGVLTTKQQYTIRNFWPITNTNFGKTMESLKIQHMTKLIIQQNKKFLTESERLIIGDAEMKIIVANGISLSYLHLECNLSTLNDRVMTGIKSRRVCNQILQTYSINPLPNTNQLAQLIETYAQTSFYQLDQLTSLKTLVLLECGPKVTDILAFFVLAKMKALKQIHVTSPKLTALGRNILIQEFKGQNLQLHWDTS